MRKRRLTLCFSALIIAVIALFAPRLVTLGWHIVHGSHVVFLNKSVPVMNTWIEEPKSWSVNNKLAFVKLPATLFLDPGNHGTIYFESNIYNQKQQLTPDGLMRAFELTNHGHSSTIEPIDIAKGPSQSLCLKITHNPPGLVQISCFLFDGQWVASYIGPGQGVGDFTNVVRGIE
jgi:hypothetical protein